ncbi:MAG: penicillin-binding transpeptidase domain-containing protein, partial [Actinomycetota bacterium]|nr:penicillin-binding transpeptidase domain-containing protein [Actinomycetota bacterium]
MNRPPSRQERQQRLKTRALPLVGIAFIAFILGVIQGCPGNPNRDSAERYVKAWEERDYAGMHSELSSKSREAIPLERFEARYEKSESIATLQAVDGDEAEGDETRAEVPVKATTLAFGEIEQPLKFTFGSDGIAWQNSLLFPGLEEGEDLTRITKLPRRAPILAKDGQKMAVGPSLAREYPLGDSMVDVTGTIAAADDLSPANEGLGFSPGEPVGVSGIELAYNGRLAGKPGGTLFAKEFKAGTEGEGRTLGQGEPVPAKPLKTTIDPAIQQAAVSAMSPYVGGAAVVDARNGRIRALAGQAYSALQPPGSTMKIITATAGLESGKVSMSDEFPYVTSAPADGREIKNSHDQVCGGVFTDAFANSCNSVFAPLAMEVGEETLTETSEKFGFNRPPQIWNAAGLEAVQPPTPSIPQPGDYNNELGVSGIGQGLVQATPLLMASAAQAIANKGEVSPTPIVNEVDLQAGSGPVRVASKKTAAQVAEMMVAVVQYGTGAAAAISEAQVAGKTGTAEVGIRGGGEVDEEGNPDIIEDAW